MLSTHLNPETACVGTHRIWSNSVVGVLVLGGKIWEANTQSHIAYVPVHAFGSFEQVREVTYYSHPYERRTALVHLPVK